MRRQASARSGGGTRSVSVQLWLVALLWFGVGDVVTTGVGLRLADVWEANPVLAGVLGDAPLAAMVLLKAVVFAACRVLWSWTPQAHAVGVPLGLATLGMLVTAWNLHVLLYAVLL